MLLMWLMTRCARSESSANGLSDCITVLDQILLMVYPLTLVGVCVVMKKFLGSAL